PVWREAQVLSAKHGLVAAAYEPRHGVHARTHQFALVHVLGPSLDVYSCPLAMTDGAARTLLASGNRELIDRVVPLLTTRDPRKVPTAGRTLAGTPAAMVGAARDGVRQITPMLSITRTWNAVSAVSAMRRGLALARDYARRRSAFGALLVDKPLHADTLAGLE